MKTEIIGLVKKHFKLVLPFILSAVLGTALFSVYSVPLFSLWTPAVIGVCALMFVFCEFINKHRFAGGVMFVIAVMLVFSAFIRLIMGSDYGETFQQWFLTGAEQVSTRFEFLLALLISFVPFFAVVVYYFTNILYRMSFLTLVSLIPCAVYVKVLSEIDNVYICLIALLNVAILMLDLRSEQNKNTRVIGHEASALSICVYTFVLLVISSAVPKENEARYYDRFEDLFMDSNINVSLGENYSLFSEFSGGADSFRNFSNRRMYTLYGDTDPYFKRQTFDYYDFENDRWYAEDYYSVPFYAAEEWSLEAQKLSLADLRKAIIAADGYEPGFADKYGLVRLSEYTQFRDPVREIIVEPENFGAVYYLSPARAISVQPLGSAEQIYVTRGGVFRNRSNIHDVNLGYRVTLFDEFEGRFLWFELGGADFDSDTCKEMLSEMQEILSENNDPLYENAEAFLSVHNAAENYKKITAENNNGISDEIRELALEITGDCTYDWEKANKLQNYFIQNDFIYDLNYVASDTSPEYFLFESKKGSCSDYATAFVLMARSLGLAVRYAEGYSPDITSRANVFVIKDSCSHAYPEVYIQNMGWIAFEPTVPSDYSELAADSNTGANIEIDYHLVFVMCIVAGIMLAAVLAFILAYPAINEKIFIKHARDAEPNRCAVMVYGRIVNKWLARSVKRSGAYTPYETASVLYDMTGCDISALAFIIESVVYGGEQAGEAQKSEAMDFYFKASDALKEYKKKAHKAERKKRK